MNRQQLKYASSEITSAVQTEHLLTLRQLPGFGLPYDDWGQDPDLYAQSISAVMNWSHEVTTTRERCMLALIDSLSDKPDWTCKVRDEAIISKWRQEVKELDWRRVVEGGDFSDKMFAFVGQTHTDHVTH